MSLGEGLSIVPTPGEASLTVVNRTGRDLRGAILKMPAGDPRYFARIRDGEKVSSQAGRELGTTPEERSWITNIERPSAAGTLDVHPLDASSLRPLLERDAPGLVEAWSALEATAGQYVDWFPPDVPVLLAQLDGGEGRTSDSGLRLESDRLLVRVVGYGGRL